MVRTSVLYNGSCKDKGVKTCMPSKLKKKCTSPMSNRVTPFQLTIILLLKKYHYNHTEEIFLYHMVCSKMSCVHTSNKLILSKSQRSSWTINVAQYNTSQLQKCLVSKIIFLGYTSFIIFKYIQNTFNMIKWLNWFSDLDGRNWSLLHCCGG